MDVHIAAVVGEVEILAVGFHKPRVARAGHVLDIRYILAASAAEPAAAAAVARRGVVRRVHSSDNLWSFKLAKKL